jgi:uncharacterized Tic20 family protein
MKRLQTQDDTLIFYCAFHVSVNLLKCNFFVKFGKITPSMTQQDIQHSHTQLPSQDERTLAILVHVLSIFFWIIPSLIVYLVKKDDSPFVAAHAREALNFQITMTLLSIALFITLIGIIFLWVPALIDLILCIVAAIKASEQKPYRYPISWRIIK